MIRPNVCILLLISIALLSGCATHGEHSYPVIEAASEHKQLVKGKKSVLIINSNRSVDRYHTAENVFIETMADYNTVAINLEAETEPVEYLQDLLNAKQFDLIYCIGAKALGSIDYIDPVEPVVYSAVLNWRRFKDHSNYFGIASELSPQVQLTWFKYFFPEINKVGVLYGDKNQALIDEALKTSKNLSLTLKTALLRNNTLLVEEAKALLGSVETLWLISDSNTLSSIKNVETLFELADQVGVPIFSYNPLFMDMGAVMSLVADLPTTARQAALLSIKLLKNTIPAQSVQFPAGSRILLSSDNIKRYKMKLNSDALDSVDEYE